jgi:hypothetical protein
MRLKIMIVVAPLVIAAGNTSAQVAVVVSPDRLEDVSSIEEFSVSDSQQLFDNFSWRSFIALNWPAIVGADNRVSAANRGLPDRRRAFGDADGPRVWMTWKSRYEIFQPKGKLPSPWASYDGQNPCGEGFVNDRVTLSSFSAFSDFDQATFIGNFGKPLTLGSPLVAQNRTYARYEVRANEPEFNSIVGNKWYLEGNLPKRENTVPFNVGSTSVKAAWRILKKGENTSRFYVVRDAQVFEFDQAANSSKCTREDVALVGFHIVTKTRERPQWIWSTFEHVDNVPPFPGTDEPTPPANVPFSFNDGSSKKLDPHSPPPISLNNPPVGDPLPTQVTRKQISPQTMRINKAYWSRPEIKGTIWQNYMLVTTQWPTRVSPEAPNNDGQPHPEDSGVAKSNSIMETYFQGYNCFACHAMSNQKGRDFVMFVTIDAVRSNILAPGDLFADKVAAAASITQSQDPLLSSLAEFLGAATQK